MVPSLARFQLFNRRAVVQWFNRSTSPLRGYFLGFFNRVRNSFIDKVDSFRLASINFQKLDEVCRATSAQSLPSTPTRMAAGLPRRVMTTLSCWDISTHSLILFCKSRALTVFIKYPQSWSREVSFEWREHRPPTRQRQSRIVQEFKGSKVQGCKEIAPTRYEDRKPF
jgi:hypothetical protein